MSLVNLKRKKRTHRSYTNNFVISVLFCVIFDIVLHLHVK